MDKLKNIQSKLKVPKEHNNKFGGYKYRNLEDIQEAVKPLLEKEGLSMIISDDITMVGDRFYVKATVKLYDKDSKVIAENTAYARESLSKKGMDESQITGACSSYARKYACNGLFLIDDSYEIDSGEPEVTPPSKEINKEEAKSKAKETEQKVSEEMNKDNVAPPPEPATASQISQIKTLATNKGSAISAINKNYGIVNLSDICWTDAKHCIDALKKREDVKK